MEILCDVNTILLIFIGVHLHNTIYEAEIELHSFSCIATAIALNGLQKFNKPNYRSSCIAERRRMCNDPNVASDLVCNRYQLISSWILKNYYWLQFSSRKHPVWKVFSNEAIVLKWILNIRNHPWKNVENLANMNFAHISCFITFNPSKREEVSKIRPVHQKLWRLHFEVAIH